MYTIVSCFLVSVAVIVVAVVSVAGAVAVGVGADVVAVIAIVVSFGVMCVDVGLVTAIDALASSSYRNT